MMHITVTEASAQNPELYWGALPYLGEFFIKKNAGVKQIK